MSESQDPNEAPRSSAAAAASRARRIGGRASAAPAPESGTTVPLGKAEVAEAKPEAPRPEVAPRPLPGWLRWIPAGVLSAGAVVMIILLVLFSHGVWWAKPSGNTVRDQVLAAGKTCVAKVNTYKYTDLSAFERTALSCTTGQLTKNLKNAITSLIDKKAPQLKAVQTAQVSTGAIETITKDGSQWTLLIFGQLQVTNTTYPSGRTDPFAAEVRMQKVHGAWLMSDEQTLCTPNSVPGTCKS